MDLLRNEDYGFGIRAKAYHPQALKFPSLRKDPRFIREVRLAVAPDGTESFIACSWRDLPRLIYAPQSRYRFWRTVDAEKATTKTAGLKAEEDPSEPYMEWDISVSLLPDEQTLLGIVQQYRLQREMRQLAA